MAIDKFRPNNILKGLEEAEERITALEGQQSELAYTINQLQVATHGEIGILVVDGGAVPQDAATVTLTHLDHAAHPFFTEEVREKDTDVAGWVMFPNLHLGDRYKIEAKKGGLTSTAVEVVADPEQFEEIVIS